MPNKSSILPKITFNEDLPIYSKKDEIISAIKENSVVIISGETGSGKTTQIPKFCLVAGCGEKGIIGCTQPRRIAAVSIAKRIAAELNDDTDFVGYKIRFSDKTSKNTKIKLMTDGVLLAEANHDKYLMRYDTIIVDEAHERSLNIDFILGGLKRLLKTRKDLKVIISSATIDTRKFSEAFYGAPIIEVSGRMFPVETKYQDNLTDEPSNYVEAAVEALEKIDKKTPFGDVLIFMPTESDINETCELIDKKRFKNCAVFPLFGRLSGEDQSKIFQQISSRKVIVATNIAETSITVPGIKYVIDTGLARISQYNPNLRISSLPVLPISKSSAEQRKGRCGRVENGVCIRLFSEEDFNARDDFTGPEILRSNLSDVILRMLYLKLGSIEKFPFIDKPSLANIKDGFALLDELGAIKKKKGKIFLTDTGRSMAKMPIDPRLARILIESVKLGCAEEICVITGVLSIMDPKIRPLDEEKKADQAHKKFQDNLSDFITFSNIWNNYEKAAEGEKTNSQKRKSKKLFCKENYLSIKRMMEWEDIYRQLKDILEENDMTENSVPVSSKKGKNDKFSEKYINIHKALLSGFLSNIACKKEKNIYRAAKEKEVMIFPGSSIFNEAGDWIIAAEFVKTSRLFARCAANIDSAWIEPLAKDKCKYSYFDPHWEKSFGRVMAYKRISLFGLIIEPKKEIIYHKIDPSKSCEIFIRDALMTSDIEKPFPNFIVKNEELKKSVIDMENRLRRGDILAEEAAIFDFYHERIKDISDIRTLKDFIKEKGSDEFLCMTEKDILRYYPSEEELALYPERINSLKCEYKFEPGKDNDGLTVKIPISLKSSINPDFTDWLVPGLLKDKIAAMIKALPKEHRKKLVPAANFLPIIEKELLKTAKPLKSALSEFIYKRFNIVIPASAWRENKLPDYLKMRIELTDKDNKTLYGGRDKSLFEKNIEEEFGDKENFSEAKKNWEKKHNKKEPYRTWDFEDIESCITLVSEGGRKSFFYPALTSDKNNGVYLKLYTNEKEASEIHKKGVMKLYELYLVKDIKFLKQTLSITHTDIGSFKDFALFLGEVKDFEKNFVEEIIKSFFYKDVRKKDDFFSNMKEAERDMLTKGRERLEFSFPVIKAFLKTKKEIAALKNKNSLNNTLKNSLEDLEKELSSIIPDNFFSLYDKKRLSRIPVYAESICMRGIKIDENYMKYIEKEKKAAFYKNIFISLISEMTNETSVEKRKRIEDFFWLLQEYNISLFTQELKTAFSVSEKKLKKHIEEINRMV